EHRHEIYGTYPLDNPDTPGDRPGLAAGVGGLLVSAAAPSAAARAGGIRAPGLHPGAIRPDSIWHELRRSRRSARRRILPPGVHLRRGRIGIRPPPVDRVALLGKRRRHLYQDRIRGQE